MFTLQLRLTLFTEDVFLMFTLQLRLTLFTEDVCLVFTLQLRLTLFTEDVCNYRAGFLVGDGAGVGKGRTIAGIILENYLHGRNKAIWVSISNDLKYDAERDLKVTYVYTLCALQKDVQSYM